MDAMGDECMEAAAQANLTDGGRVGTRRNRSDITGTPANRPRPSPVLGADTANVRGVGRDDMADNAATSSIR